MTAADDARRVSPDPADHGCNGDPDCDFCHPDTEDELPPWRRPATWLGAWDVDELAEALAALDRVDVAGLSYQERARWVIGHMSGDMDEPEGDAR